jgi:hypothetical protein
MRDEEAYTAAIDVVDAGDEKDERKDSPAQAGYGVGGLQRGRASGGTPLGSCVAPIFFATVMSLRCLMKKLCAMTIPTYMECVVVFGC